MIESQLTGILQDVTVYYTKKLDMYRIKMEHHQRTRPDRAHYELASILIESYEDHPNRDELWKDMFCRLVEDEAMPYHATAIQRWMQEELQIKAAMRACIQDLRRERDKVCTMCDFHNFGLIFAGQMHCLPQRLKSTLFEIFSNGGCPKGTRSVEKISNNIDFSL